MNMGKKIRMGRLFNQKSGRMVLIPMDHGICVKPMKGMAEPKKVIRALVEGGAEATLLTPGIARYVQDEIAGKIALFLRIDGTATSIGPDLSNDRLIYSVEGALRMGADAVATFGVIGVNREAELSEKIGKVHDECERLGMPMLTEMCPPDIAEHQFKAKAGRQWPKDPEIVKFSARVAAELGADIVKGYYTGDAKTFKELISYCPVPYVVLGGPVSADPEIFLSFIKDAIDCGAAGVSVGRNVWSYREPAKMVRAICGIVHNNFTVKEAMQVIATK